MKNNRAFNLLVAFGLFAGVSWLLFAHGRWFLWIFPAYGAVFLWFSWRPEKELKFIFLFLATTAGFIMPRFSPGADSLSGAAMTLAEILSLWLLFYALSSSERGRDSKREKISASLAKAREREKNLREELQRYLEHKAVLLDKIKLQEEIAVSIRHMASASGASEIKLALEARMKSVFAGCNSRLDSGAPSDFIETWVSERKIPLLIRNSEEETRFSRALFGPEQRSLIAAPLYFFGSMAGFLRVSSPEPGRFTQEDLRAAELLATLAGVSMENIYLFEKVRELAIKDALTGLYTHRAFQSRIEEEILRAARARTPFSLVMADIDHFKSYNDNYGHQAGDTVLKAVAEILSSGVRDIDFVARYGGEEFAIIFTGADKRQAAEAADQLRKRLESEKFSFNGKHSGVTASFGAAQFPSDGATSSQLVRAADERLYKAKEAGRNRVVYE
ncbi:MAG TPA: hypothetical protein DCL44_12215 [Elusimicrobia bacterium]|nr:hypothetical protein [Elusimicrobiota bacterium]